MPPGIYTISNDSLPTVSVKLFGFAIATKLEEDEELREDEEPLTDEELREDEEPLADADEELREDEDPLADEDPLDGEDPSEGEDPPMSVSVELDGCDGSPRSSLAELMPSPPLNPFSAPEELLSSGETSVRLELLSVPVPPWMLISLLLSLMSLSSLLDEQPKKRRTAETSETKIMREYCIGTSKEKASSTYNIYFFYENSTFWTIIVRFLPNIPKFSIFPT